MTAALIRSSLKDSNVFDVSMRTDVNKSDDQENDEVETTLDSLKDLRSL